jgi:hypothetical protein
LLTKSLAPLFRARSFVIGLRRQHQDGQIAARLDFLQAFHHLESIEAGHQDIEQDQVVAVFAVKLLNLARISRRRDGHITGAVQHALQHQDIGFLIVNHQDLAAKEVG